MNKMHSFLNMAGLSVGMAVALLIGLWIRPNTSGDKVRIAQYVSMMPAEEDNEELRQWRITSWSERKAPEGFAFPGDPRNWEQTKYKAAELTSLGRKLLGLDKW